MGQKVRYMPLLKDLSFLFLMLSTLLFANCQSTLVNFLALISAREGVGAGRFFFVTFCVAILALLTMGKVMDRFGKRLFLKLAYPLFALGLFLIPGLVGSWPYLLNRHRANQIIANGHQLAEAVLFVNFFRS